MGTIILRFNDIVDKIYSLPLDEKMELKDLLEQNIADVRRNEIASSFIKAKEEYRLGKLEFSSNINDLKRML